MPRNTRSSRREPNAPPFPTRPGRITAIDASVRRPGRFEIAVDGAGSAILSLASIERLGLRVRIDVDASLAARIDHEAAALRTYDRATTMLAARGRSAAELRRLLVRKGEPPDHVDQAIERLSEAGFLDDARFARQFARAKAVGAGLPRRRVQQELGRLGVAREVAEDAVADVFAEEEIDDAASIERVAEKKFRTLSRLDAGVQRRRLYGFLARRGFDGDAIQQVVRRLVSAPDHGD